MNITEFLEARIAEDEAVARAAFDRPFLSRTDDGKWEANTSNTSPSVEGRAFFSIAASDDEPQAFLTSEQADHIARHDPARVLAECAAKRAIVGEHELVEKVYLKDYCSTCADWENSEFGEGPPGIEWPCPTLRAVAAVYASHPDYQQEAWG